MTYKEIFDHALAGGEFVDNYGCVWSLDAARDRWRCNQGHGWEDAGEPLLYRLRKYEPERVAYLHRRVKRANGGLEWDELNYDELDSSAAEVLKLTYRGDELVDAEVVKS